MTDTKALRDSCSLRSLEELLKVAILGEDIGKRLIDNLIG
jgi:hypothetical protein